MCTQNNLELWNSVCITDAKYVKPIIGRSYKGTSPQPQWLVKRATETFGPIGIGWGFRVISERLERFGDHNVVHICHLEFWYKWNGEIGKVEHMGQTKQVYMTAMDKVLVDEDACKKSVTDALVKCMSLVGFAGDIFLGRWDDQKYQDEAKEHWAAINGTSGSDSVGSASATTEAPPKTRAPETERKPMAEAGIANIKNMISSANLDFMPKYEHALLSHFDRATIPIDRLTVLAYDLYVRWLQLSPEPMKVGERFVRAKAMGLVTLDQNSLFLAEMEAKINSLKG